MDRLEIKRVPFMGTELVAARDSDGQIWAGVRWMCDGVGLSHGQMLRQVTNIKEDTVLSKGVANLQLPTNGGNQKCLCLKLDYVPLWLAKIAITPKMEREAPDLAVTLEQYQLKAKDVLAAAFLPQEVWLSSLLYPPKATSLGEVVRFLSLMEKTMEKNDHSPETISRAFEAVCIQFGVVLPADFVKVPPFQQISIVGT